MSLMTVGRNAVVASQLAPPPQPPPGETAEEKAARLEQQLAEARKSLLDTLTPWIPGDFIVAYSTLLTAVTALQSNFAWMMLLSAILSIVFVWGTAFSATGFKTPADRPFKRLTARTIMGFGVAVLAAVAIPSSGWYDFRWFADNQSSAVLTAGIVASALVLLLKGFQKLIGD
jgi:hypothetical protein